MAQLKLDCDIKHPNVPCQTSTTNTMTNPRCHPLLHPRQYQLAIRNITPADAPDHDHQPTDAFYTGGRLTNAQ